MKKLKQFLKSPKATVLLFILAAGLLIAGGIGTARAALTAFSERRVYQVELKHIDIGLLENGERVDEDHVLLKKLTAEGEQIRPGQEYPEALALVNLGGSDMYVRVSVYVYWLDAEGNKNTELSPALIGLHFTPGDNWLIDEASSTPERTVLYYRLSVKSGEKTDPFSDFLKLDPSLADAVTETRTEKDGFTVIRRTYDYDGCQFMVEARADGVQTHSAEAAILSAWGQRVSVKDGVLSLKEAD